ncbi:MAG: dynamin family protein [Actinomycetota bacterium]
MTDVRAALAPLTARVRALVDQAHRTYQGHAEHEAALAALRARLDEPLRVAIAGRVKSGKSTLLNALVGQPLAATDAAECTRTITWYRHGRQYKAYVQPRDADLEQVRLERTAAAVEVDLGGRDIDSLERIVIEWPASLLESMTLVDTPGLGSLSTEVSERATEFLAPEDSASSADAVVYLARHLHGHDVRFLEAFHDEDAGKPNPVNAIGVLARADEIGGCRLDALDAAARVTDRYRTDQHVRRLCQTVVPVAGLLAEGSTLLTEAEFRALGRLAEVDDATAEEVLVSTDRFAGRPAQVDLATEEREHLLELLGLFGVRLARDLLRRGEVRNAPDLATALTRRSGLDELRRVLATQFASRAELLKARAALGVLDRVLRAEPPSDGGVLAGAVEEVEANAHELAELRLLVALRSGAVELPEDEAGEVERLIERTALPTTQRLELAPEADRTEVEHAVMVAIERWRRRAEHPLAPPEVVAAAQVVQRSYEGMLLES